MIDHELLNDCEIPPKSDPPKRICTLEQFAQEAGITAEEMAVMLKGPVITDDLFDESTLGDIPEPPGIPGDELTALMRRLDAEVEALLTAPCDLDDELA